MALDPFIVAGATVQFDCMVEAIPDGDSVLNVRLCAQSETEIILKSVKLACNDTAWQLILNDVVYVGDERHPSIVIRNGWGAYEKEVRIAGVKDDLSKHQTGRWVGTDRCYRLEPGDRLRAIAPTQDASEDEFIIPEGAECKFLSWDKDGDAVISHSGRRLTVFIEDMHTMTLL